MGAMGEMIDVDRLILACENSVYFENPHDDDGFAKCLAIIGGGISLRDLLASELPPYVRCWFGLEWVPSCDRDRLALRWASRNATHPLVGNTADTAALVAENLANTTAAIYSKDASTWPQIIADVTSVLEGTPVGDLPPAEPITEKP